MWGNGRRLLDASTYVDIGRVPDGSGNQSWSNIEPHRMYGVSGHDGNILQWEPGQAGWTVIDTIPYPDLYMGDYEGGLGGNDLAALNSGDTVIVYDFANRRLVATRYIPNMGAVDMSVSGRYVVTDSDANGFGEGFGTWVYDAATMEPVRQVHSYIGDPVWRGHVLGHQDLGLDAQGRDVIVYVEPGGGGTMAQSLLVEDERWVARGIFGVGHVSCTNYERPGWCLLSSNSNYPGAAGWDQVVAAKLDGSELVEVFARMHNENAVTHQQYDRSPHATFNRAGDVALFSSVWSDTAGSPTFAYVAGMNP